MKKNKTDSEKQIKELQRKLSETTAELQAIREGTVDAVVVSKNNQKNIYSLGNTNMKKMLEGVSDGILAFDTKWNFTFVNAQGAKTLGRSEKDLMGKNLWKEFPELAKTPFGKLYKKAMRDKKAVMYEDFYEPFQEWFTVRVFPSAYGMSLFFQNISERKDAEEKLKESETKYRSIFNTMDQGMCILQILYSKQKQPVDYRFMEINPMFERQTGLKNALGKTARELVPNLEKKWIETYASVAKTGKPIRFIDNSVPMGRWFDVYAFRIGEKNDNKVALLFTDITKNKQMEESLRERENKFREMADHAPVMIWITDPKGVCTYLNKGWYSYTGQTEKEALGFGWLNQTHPDDREQAEHIFLNANKKRVPFSIEYRLKGKDGIYRWCIDRGIPKFNEKKEFEGYIGTVVEIHETKVALEQIDEGKKRESMVIGATKLGLWYCDLPFDELKWDKNVKQHFFLPESSRVTIDTFYERLHPDDRERTRKAISESIENHTTYDIVYRTTHPKHPDKINWIRAIGKTFYDQKNNPIRFDGITLDITAQKILERQKDDFISIASHELKTPVTSLKAYTQVLQLLLKKNKTQDFGKHLSKMDGQLDKLTDLIGDLLDVTKIESGRLQFNLSTFDFDTLVDEARDTLQLTTDKHTLIVDGKSNTKIYGDKERIGQVITNLITNAIKYSPHSDKVIITPSKENETVKLCVQDFGVGIPKSKQDKVFERFFRVSGPNTQTFPGLGLGLYISSEIIKRLGGRIWVEESSKKGTLFCFVIPIKKRQITQEINTEVESEIRHS